MTHCCLKVTNGTAMNERWATFDCYGTLIDWNRGIRRCPRLASSARQRADAGLRRGSTRSNRDSRADGRLTYRRGPDRSDAAARRRRVGSRRSPSPCPVAGVSRGAPRARGRPGKRLAAGDPLEHRSRLHRGVHRQIGVPFDLAIVASEIGSYKPATTTGPSSSAHRCRPASHVHVAASLFHDIAPAASLALRAVWINRLGERSPLPRLASFRT